jgi:hypothetical protein
MSSVHAALPEGLSQGNLGRMSTALATLEEAIQMAGRNGDRFWFPRIPNCIGWVHRELQDFEGAFKYDREGLEAGRHYHVLEAEANSARKSFAQAAEIIQSCAASVTDENLRATFLNSKAVRAVLAGAG